MVYKIRPTPYENHTRRKSVELCGDSAHIQTFLDHGPKHINGDRDPDLSFTALADVPQKDFIRRFCFIHLKNNSTCHYARHNSAMVVK